MSRNVFILGAGASARGGAPMMNTFIKAAQEIMRGTFMTPKEVDAGWFEPSLPHSEDRLLAIVLDWILYAQPLQRLFMPFQGSWRDSFEVPPLLDEQLKLRHCASSLGRTSNGGNEAG